MVRPPRGSTRSAKYIVEVAEASEAVGLQAQTMAQGVDLLALGQTGTFANSVPVGSKIALFDIRMPKINLASTANFVHWSIQRTVSGQSLVNPSTAGGSPLRKNILLSGIVGLGEGQNNQLHIRYKVPKKFQRIGDGDVWSVVMNNGQITSTVYEFVYKVFQ